VDNKIIYLTQGFVAIVSAADHEKIKIYMWHVHRSGGKGKKLGNPYARTTISGKKVYMHRLIASPEDNLQVDHRNGQTLDDRRVNIEPVDNKTNQRRKIKYTGVRTKKEKTTLTLDLF